MPVEALQRPSARRSFGPTLSVPGLFSSGAANQSWVEEPSCRRGIVEGGGPRTSAEGAGEVAARMTGLWPATRLIPVDLLLFNRVS